MSEPKDQHAVPQFHLRNWCSDQDNKLQAYRWLPNGKLESKRRGPAEVCRELHLYSLRIHEKKFKYIVENVFQKLETRAAPIAEKLLQGIIPTTSEERSMWTCYLLAQRVRVKNTLEEILARCQRVVDGNLEQIQFEYVAPQPIVSASKSIVDALYENIAGLGKNVTMLSMINFLVEDGRR